MGGKDFCGFLQHLQAASPALSARELPTLHALSSLAAEFQPVSTSAESPGMLLWSLCHPYMLSVSYTPITAVSLKLLCQIHDHSIISRPSVHWTLSRCTEL